MPIIMPFAIFAGLLLVILLASYLLSRGAEVLAEKWGKNIAGSLILALVTTLPEYAFVFWACMKSEYTMAIGSAIGACTLLITLGYGSIIVIATSKLSRKPVKEIILSKTTKVDALYLAVTALVAFFFISVDNALQLWEGILLTIILGGYVFHIIHDAKHSHVQPDMKKSVLLRGAAELILGGVLVYFASEPFVDSMIEIAKEMKISPAVIAIILGPIASELPEKLTAYMVVMKNGANAELSICNFLGSKVNHNSLLLAVIPFVAFFKHGQTSVSGLMSPMFVVMSVLTIIVSVLLSRGRLKRWEGWVLIALYVVSMILAFFTGGGGAH